MVLNGNVVDLIIVLVLAYFVFQGYRGGFWTILIDFISFFGSLLFALRVYPYAASFLQKNLGFNKQIGTAGGFLITAIIAEMVLSLVLTYLVRKLSPHILKNHIARVFGVLLAFGQGIILIAFLLILIISLPLDPNLKVALAGSRIGGFVLSKTTGTEAQINKIFGGAIDETLAYLTVEPGSNQTIHLDNTTNNLAIDAASEDKMLILLNQERRKSGLPVLSNNLQLKVIARNYGQYMWENHYFGHYDLSGRDIAYRLALVGINYTFAGENLALAPTVDLAHTGLMNSPGHRANILDANYRQVGIGVIDNGYYGKIFVQEFSD